MDNFQPALIDGVRSREASPNRGASVPDNADTQEECEDVGSWRRRCDIDISKQIRLVKLVHMRYRHPDLATITTFLRDFGMVVAKKSENRIWYKGYGSDQYVYYAEEGERKYLGGTFEVESMQDLERAATLPGAGEIEELKDAPGGGYLITLTDPGGFIFNLMYGQTPAEVETDKLPSKLVVNSETEKPRKRQFQRFQPGPAAVHKLGHFGLCVTNFPAQVEFYTRNFNIVPTDFLFIPDADAKSGKRDVAIFAHIDRGQDLVDHHSFFMTSNKTAHVHHSSFEVHDFDTQHLGHQWLAKKGYKSVWGVGRHILGSQIFDYWWDTTGNMIEHYADGDLINEDTPIHYVAAGDESLAVWGPELPKTFLD